MMECEREDSAAGVLGWVDVMATIVLVLAVALFLVLVSLGQQRKEAAVREEAVGTLSGQVATLEQELRAARDALEATQRTLVTTRQAHAEETAGLRQRAQALAAQLQLSAREQARLEALVAELQRAPAQRFVLTNEQEDRVFFDTGQAVIKEAFKPILDRYVEEVHRYLARDPSHLVQVEGHTDDVPCCRHSPYADNWELSVARATAVVKYFAQRGVDPGRLVAVGHSAYKPRLAGKTEQSRGQNRRIEIVFITRPLEAEGSSSRYAQQ